VAGMGAGSRLTRAPSPRPSRGGERGEVIFSGVDVFADQPRFSDAPSATPPGSKYKMDCDRGRRCAQPPANGYDPSGVGGEGQDLSGKQVDARPSPPTPLPRVERGEVIEFAELERRETHSLARASG